VTGIKNNGFQITDRLRLRYVFIRYSFLHGGKLSVLPVPLDGSCNKWFLILLSATLHLSTDDHFLPAHTAFPENSAGKTMPFSTLQFSPLARLL